MEKGTRQLNANRTQMLIRVNDARNRRKHDPYTRIDWKNAAVLF